MKRFAPAPHSRLGNRSGTIAGAIVVKENVDFVGATTGRPRFVKEIFGLLLLSFYGGGRATDGRPYGKAFVSLTPYWFGGVFGWAGVVRPGLNGIRIL